MSVSAVPKLEPMEKSELWQEACSLAEYMYGLLTDFPPEESYNVAGKLRMAAIDLMYAVSQGLGNSNPSGREYDWGYARKSINGLKTIYRFAGKQKFIALDPDIMVRFDKLLKQIDTEVAKGYKESAAYYDKEMQTWRLKYEIWKKDNNEV
ncbi:MAG: hypothetical protein JWL89_335 [Candidatus Saccharibacteria bacterium]|nr:hypothetical protein [Candidatus Saccharibacteria bacterium]